MCNHHCDKTCPSDPKLPVSVRANRRVSLLTQETLKHLVNHSLTADNPAHKKCSSSLPCLSTRVIYPCNSFMGNRVVFLRLTWLTPKNFFK